METFITLIILATIGIGIIIIIGQTVFGGERMRYEACDSGNITILRREPVSTEINYSYPNNKVIGVPQKPKNYGFPGQKRVFSSGEMPVDSIAPSSIKIEFDVKYRCKQCGHEGEQRIVEAR